MRALSDRDAAAQSGLVRALGPWDAVLLTVGSVVGTGVFLTSSDIARALPHAGLLLAIWLVGGLLTLAGALTYAELGALYPEAGGVYVYLREAWGARTAFLYGWGAFLVIMSGGMAAIGVGFGTYLGAFVPALSSAHVLVEREIAGYGWRLTGAQLAGAAAILVLTAVNHFGLRSGAGVQNLLTALKVAAFAAFCVGGFLVPARAPIELAAPVDADGLLRVAVVGMIAALWTYDGWYATSFSAGEMRRPERTLPIGIVGGTLAVTALYLVINVVYLRALPVERMGEEPRVAEAAAAALFGPAGGRAIAAAIVVSAFGCLAATILYSSRIYAPMAADGVFFPALAEVSARWRVPTRSLWWQSAWAVVLTLSGSYEQLYTYVVFVSVIFHVLAAAAVFRLRRTRPELPRPFRVPLGPWIPIAFIAASVVLAGSTLYERPAESLAGLGLLALGLPAYAAFRSASRAAR
jgi:APA family basic amino acid/polyamine antiporter